MPVKLGVKNFYLYSAVELGTGDHCTLEIPYVNADCLNIFLDEFSKSYPDDSSLLIMDGAEWHKSKKLVRPANIEILYLPPTNEINDLGGVLRSFQKFKFLRGAYGEHF